jgi:hypothetical protein
MGQNAAVAGDDPEQVELGFAASNLAFPKAKMLFNIFNPIGVQQTMCSKRHQTRDWGDQKLIGPP